MQIQSVNPARPPVSAVKLPSKTYQTNGPRECARRVRQAEAIAAKQAARKSRKDMWHAFVNAMPTHVDTLPPPSGAARERLRELQTKISSWRTAS